MNTTEGLTFDKIELFRDYVHQANDEQLVSMLGYIEANIKYRKAFRKMQKEEHFLCK